MPTTLKVVSILNDPFLMKDENDNYYGFVKDLLDALSKLSKYNYEIIPSQDGKYGALNPETGKWNGMVGMIQDGEAEFIAADLTINAKRGNVLDFTSPFLSNPLQVLARKTPENLTFLAPFSWDLWLLFFLLLIVTSLVLWLVARISPEEKANAKNIQCPTGSLWFLFSSIFRGSNYTPKTYSAQIMTAGWWIFAFLVIITYARNLGPPGGYQYNFVEEMVQNPDFHFGVIEGGATYQLMNSSSAPLHKQIFEKIRNSPEESFITSYKSGLDKVNDGNFGIILEGSQSEYLIGEDCSLYSIGQLSDRHYALAFKKNSIQRRKHDEYMLKLQETGKIFEIEEKWLLGRASSCMNLIDYGDTIDIVGMLEPIIFLIIMMFLALVIAFIELILAAKKSRRDTPRREINVGATLKDAFCGCFGKGTTAPNNAPQNAQTLPLKDADQS